MSLDTVLKIGNALRNSNNSLKYFKYVEACPKDKDGNYPICITIPVKKDFSFDWDNIKFTPENERENLYYLKFKTSDADSLMKYIFGDIYYEKRGNLKKTLEVEASEGGYFRLEDPNAKGAFKQNSFFRGLEDYMNIIRCDKMGGDVLEKFHHALKDNITCVERLLKYIPAISHFIENSIECNITEFLSNEENLYTTTILQNKITEQTLKKLGISTPLDVSVLNNLQKKCLFDLTSASIFIHFEFPEKKHWYQFSDELDLITEKILSEFVENSNYGQVLKKTLYKTLCSGDSKNDIQFPMFSITNKYKSKNFANNELQDLFYAIDFTSKGKLISGTDIKLIVLPCGNNLTVQNYETFFEKRDENRVVAENNNDEQRDILFSFSLDGNKSITSFDLIFCKKGGLTSPDSDLIEISGIEKSKLRLIMERINKISKEIEQERKEFIKTDNDLFPLKIDFSFRCILGNPQYDEKKKKVSYKSNPKYQSHLLKVLPLIYTESYFQDDMLLPAFIQNVEFSIRSGDSKYSFLKYDLKFLLSIQNNNSKNKYMEIVDSKSYQIGLGLGKLSKPLRKAINSFEKRYVGLLTRHVSTKDDCCKFVKEINEMLVRHDKLWGQLSSETTENLVKLPNNEYNKEHFAIGFMEGYFKYENSNDKKVLVSKIEKIISDYEGKEDFQSEIQILAKALQEIK